MIANSWRQLKYPKPPVKVRKTAPALVTPSESISPAEEFIDRYIIIDNAQPGETELSEMPFRLWEAQRDLLAAMISERLLLILKARQLGISWLVLAYALWLCLYHGGRLVLVFSIGQSEANEMLRRVHAMYWRLPAELRATLPSITKDNTEEMAWSNGSRILSLPARKTAGSGYTASLAIMDEFAKNERDAAIYTAVKPTIDGGGQMIILSTANGASNVFYSLVQRAIQSAGRFVFRFLPWHARPGRDAAWYAAVEADAIDASHMKQEYPATPEEAFEATEVDAFLSDMALWRACQAEIPPLDAHTRVVLSLDAAESNDTFASTMVSLWGGRYACRYNRPYVPVRGEPLDFDEIEIDLRELGQSHAIQELTYDPMLLGQLIRRLKKPATLYRKAAPDVPLVFPAFPAPCVPFPQGAKRLEADKGIYDLITQRRFAHSGDPALTAHVANANKKIGKDSRTLRIVKREYAKKIDSLVCLSMGTARAAEVLGLARGADLVASV